MNPPDRPVPFFAPRSGAIPRAGRPKLAGIPLPDGTRHPERPAAYWATEEPVPNAVEIADQLAAAFPQTGVWPLLWHTEEDPSQYMYGGGMLREIAKVDVQELLQDRWASAHGTQPDSAQPIPPFPGLAPASPPPENPPAPFTLAASNNDPPGRLLLIPCNRPADAITQLGGVASTLDAHRISAVLRSWEERFAAAPVHLAPAALTLAVASPPTNHDQWQRLTAEHHALEERHTPQSESTLTPHRWEIAWRD